MTSALAWLEPGTVLPVTLVGHGAGARYDGLLVPTPEGGTGAVDLLGGPEGRAASLRPVVPAGAAVARQAAVWVHTGRLLCRRTDVVVEPEHRVPATVVVHRQRLGPTDVVRLGGVRTTTPLRTAVDLLCFTAAPTAVLATRVLFASGCVEAQLVREALTRPGRHLPARRALTLLVEAEAEDGRRRR